MISPKFELYRLLRVILDEVSRDFFDATNEENTMLYVHFNDNQYNKLNMFEQAKVIFIEASKDENRALNIQLDYNLQRNKLPLISIVKNSESVGHLTALGDIGTTHQVLPTVNNPIKAQYYDKRTMSFDASYDLLITANTADECEIIYSFIRSLIVSFREVFEDKGFINLTIMGQDITLNEEQSPMMFSTIIRLSFTYTFEVRAANLQTMMKNIRLELNKVQ